MSRTSYSHHSGFGARRFACLVLIGLATMVFGGSCPFPGLTFVSRPIETRFNFVNLSTEMYAMIGIREHGSGDAYRYTPLLPPGGATRDDFLVFLGAETPDEVDLQLFLYRRVNRDVPIGADPDETVEQSPVVAGEALAIPAGSVQVLETFTIVTWDAPEGIGRVKIAQCSAIDQAIRDSGRFGEEGVWEVAGVDVALADVSPNELDMAAPIEGRVFLSNGDGVANVGVLVRSLFRTRLDCADSGNENDSGFTDPIAFTMTDDEGRYLINRPPGAYQLEFFSDEYAFRPGVLVVRTPLDAINVLAEPL